MLLAKRVYERSGTATLIVRGLYSFFLIEFCGEKGLRAFRQYYFGCTGVMIKGFKVWGPGFASKPGKGTGPRTLLFLACLPAGEGQVQHRNFQLDKQFRLYL